MRSWAPRNTRSRSAQAEAASRWRCIDDGSGEPPEAPGYVNMAIDAALLASVADGAVPSIRFYRWSPACLSFGRNQAARDVYDRDRAAGRGWDVVRRPTGGLAVLHDAELTCSVVVPLGRLGGPRATYRRIHQAIAAGLATLGVRTSLAAAGSARTPDGAAACFASPAGGEILVAGRKLVGSAQRVERRTILQHGSLLLSGRQARVDEVRADADAPNPDGSIALDELLAAAPSAADLSRALASGFAAELGIALEPADLSDDERGLARRLEATYRDDAWTWRR